MNNNLVYSRKYQITLHWCHDERYGVSNHQRLDCLLNRLFRCRSKKTSKLRVTGLCEGNSPVNGEFPSQRASNAENDSISWRHHVQMVVYVWAVVCLLRMIMSCMETLSVVLTLCEGNPPVSNEPLNKQFNCRWSDTPCRFCSVIVMVLCIPK